MKMTYAKYKVEAWDGPESYGDAEITCAGCGEIINPESMVTPCHPTGYAEASGHGGYDWMVLYCIPEADGEFCNWGGPMQDIEPLLVHNKCLKSPFLEEVKESV